jgi:hypothetical protein
MRGQDHRQAGPRFEGPARVYDSEEDMLAGLERGDIRKGDVIVIRYEGPRGGPGMPEMLTPTSAWPGRGCSNDVALITDGRFSGGSHGFIIGHVVPEAVDGGPIALVQTATASPSIRRRAAWIWTSMRRNWPSDAASGTPRAACRPAGRWASMCAWWPTLRTAA